MIDPPTRRPLVLIASHGEWLGRSLESVLEQHGYSVLRVEDGHRALEVARTTNPDALLLNDTLAGIGGLEVCRTLRDDPSFDHAIPIFISAPAPTAHRMRVEAYAAGAWDYASQPIDVETMLLKLATFCRGRREMEEARAKVVIDPLTGLYSQYGLQQLAQQLGARAIRKGESFACVVVKSADPEEDRASAGTEGSRGALADMAELCRTHGRRSDAIGYLGDAHFAILAPETDAAGAVGFVERLQRWSKSTLRAGYCAIPDLSTSGIAPDDVLRRAVMAFQHAHSGPNPGGPFNFDDLPVN
jgi:two-component system cell cycle response regulator